MYRKGRPRGRPFRVLDYRGPLTTYPLGIPCIRRTLIMKEVIAMVRVLDRITVIAHDENGDSPADHDIETVETLPLDFIAIERWLTEGGRVLAGEFDQ